MWIDRTPCSVCYGPEGEGAGGAAGGDGGAGGQAPPPPPGDGGQQQTPPPPPATIAPWAEAKDAPWTIGDKPWWDTIPEQPVRELMATKAYKTPHETALAYYNLNKLTSSTRPTVPAEDAPPEAWDAFHKTLGRPDKPTDYKIEPPPGTDIQYDPSMVDFGRNLAHKLGLNQKQVETMLVPEWNKYVTTATQQMTEAQAANNAKDIEDLTKSWGGEANVNANVAAGKRTVAALGLSDGDLAALEKNMGAAPVVNLMVKLGSKFADSGMGGAPVNDGGSGGMPSSIAAMTPHQAATELSKLDADPAFSKAYWSAQDPGHREAVDRKMQLAMKAGSLYRG